MATPYKDDDIFKDSDVTPIVLQAPSAGADAEIFTDPQELRPTLDTGDGTQFINAKEGAKYSLLSEPVKYLSQLDGAAMGKTLLRGLLEGGGAAGAGMLALPTAPSTLGLGPIAAGAAGYAGGKQLADLLLGENKPATVSDIPKTLAKDLYDGLQYEAFGKGAGGVASGVKWLGNAVLPTLTRKGVSVAAGNMLKEMEPAGLTYAKNYSDAARVASETGMPLTPPQMSGQPSAARILNQAQTATPKAHDLYEANQASAYQKLRDYLNSVFTGQGTADDVFSTLKAGQSAVENRANIAGKNTADQYAKVTPQITPQAIGNNIINTIEDARLPIKAEMSANYAKVQNTPIGTQNLDEAVAAVRSEIHPEGEQQVLDGLVKYVDKVKAARNGMLTVNDLAAIDSTLGSAANESAMGGKAQLSRKINALKDAVNADFDASGDTAYKAARKAYKEQMVIPFKEGVVGEVLGKGKGSNGLRLPSESIPAKMWTETGADNYITAVGKEAAAETMRPYAYQQMLDAMGSNPSTEKLTAWVTRNRSILTRYGLEGEFNNLKSAQRSYEAAKEMEKEWGKTAAARMLNTDDPVKAIEVAFANSKNSVATTRQLLEMVKGDPRATEGLKNSFKDFFISKAENASKDVSGMNVMSSAKLQSLFKDYDGVMRVLYANEPEKIKALRNVHDAIIAVSRGNTRVAGGNSATAQNLMDSTIANRFFDAIGIGAITRISSGIAKATSGIGRDAINELVVEASFDANLAAALKKMADAAKNKVPKSSAAFRAAESVVIKTVNNIRNRKKNDQ